MKLFRVVSFVSLALLLSHAVVTAYPISPQTLWDLVSASDLIVVARVQGTTDIVDLDDDAWWDTEAHLTVLETWKGSPRSEVDVSFAQGLICPAPARYVEGETVLAFLRRTEGTWTTVGLSYGTRYFSEQEISDYRDVVALAIEAQRPRAGRLAKTEWLVEAAARPATRWDGLYGLVPDADKLHAYYDQTGRRGDSDVLAPAALEKIAKSIVADPPTDITLPMALQLLSTHPDPNLNAAFVSAVEALVELEKPPYWTVEAMREVFRRYGDTRPEDRVAALGEFYDERNPAKVREVWFKGKTDLQIPDTEPVELPAPGIPGVGPKTPS